MTLNKLKKIISKILSFTLIFSFLYSVPVEATNYKQQAEERKSMEKTWKYSVVIKLLIYFL